MNEKSRYKMTFAATRNCWSGVMVAVWLITLKSIAAFPPALITTQPVSQTVLSGSNVTFNVVATSGTAMSYQWYFNSIIIKSATNNNYTVTKVQFTNAGPYYVNVVNAGGTVKSSVATLNVKPPAGSILAAPWVSTDIGAVGLTGRAYNVANNYTVNGAGASLVGAAADQFQYVYQAMPGNGSLVARIVGQSGTNANGYAGLMIRETTTTGSRFMFAAHQGNGTTVARTRASTGGATTSTNGPSLALPNCWLKLVRTGNSIAALASTNGSAWIPVQTNSLIMATNVTFGLFATSGNTNVLDSDVFTNITAIP
jgi:hypothetical protein